MKQLRPFQKECLAAFYRYLATENGHCAAAIATGCGKSLIAAELCKWALSHVLDAVIYIIVPTQELCEQNYKEMLEAWPEAPAGIYCAGLNRKEKDKQLIFGTIQSLSKAKKRLPKANLIIADECDGIPHSSTGMWRTLIAYCESRDENLRVLGLTATPFRFSTGRLDEGENKLFDKIVYEYGIAEGIRDGFLSPLVTKDTNTKLDVSGVPVRGGDYADAELQRAVDKDEINRAIVEESIRRAGERKWWLFFCTGIEHSKHMAEILQEKGIKAEALSSKDSKDERKRKIEGFRSGEIQTLCSTNILTRGFNVKEISFIAMVRPTKSPNFFIQALGRGTRLHPSKRDCMVADYSGNLLHFGPIDKIDGRRKPKGKGEAPLRVCPQCDSIILAAYRKCPDCGYEFPVEEKNKFHTKAFTGAILSGQDSPPQELQVDSVKYSLHQKLDRPACMRVTYQCGLLSVSEFIHFEINIARAERWWKSRSSYPLPKTAKQALVFSKSLKIPSAIIVKQNGKYLNVENYLWNNVSYVQEKQTGTAGVFREALTGQRNI